MKKLILIIVLIVLMLNGIASVNYQNDTAFLQIPFSETEIVADGDLSEWTDFFETTFRDTASVLRNPNGRDMYVLFDGGSIEDAKNPLSKNSVNVRLCWNLENLNLAFVVSDEHLFAEIKVGNDNPDIYLNDGIEFYIDTHNDSKTLMDINDYQILVDILNNTTIFRGDYNKIGDPVYSVPKDRGQNMLVYSGVKVMGNLNDSEANDTGFIVELVIPFASLGMKARTQTQIKIDVCNNDNDHPLYVYSKNKKNKIPFTRPFDWRGYNDYGFPDFWTKTVLTGEPGWWNRITMKSKVSWFYGFAITAMVTIILLIFTFLRIRKLQQIPKYNPDKSSGILSGNNEKKSEIIPTINEQYLQKAAEFIKENATKPINSESVAQHLCISLRKFQRLTQEELNITPTTFILTIKLDLAADFIRINQGNISEAAGRFGFSSPSYFTKLFRERFGKTPGDYKKNV